MLRTHWITSSAAAKAYFRQSDYYAVTPGEWLGEGAKTLGLVGEARAEDFDLLCDNINPQTGTSLTTYTRDNRRVGMDLTFNSTKSVGIIRELAGPNNAGDPAVEAAHREAVAYAMRFVEDDMKARVRAGGKDEDRVTGNMVAYRVTHRDTRISAEDQRPDMSLHDHVFVLNATYDAVDGKWKAAQMGDIKHDAPFYEAIYHNRLASNLRELGYGIQKKEKAFEVTGVSTELVKKFSRRREYIKAVADKLGITSAAGMDKLGATTRLGKAKELADDLNGYFVSRLTDEERQELGDLKGQPSYLSSNEEAARYAIDHVFHSHNVFETKRLYETALRFGIGSVTPEGIAVEAKRQGLLEGSLPTGGGWMSGYCTTANRDGEEKRLIEFAREGRCSVAPFLEPSVRWKPAEDSKVTLSDEQEAAINGLLHSANVVNLVDAGQGTGKTTMLQNYSHALADLGKRTTWLGTTHTAVGEMHKAGLPAMTVAAFLGSLDERTKAVGTRIILDEASMLSHADHFRLSEFARANDCRIDFIGDSKQYKTPVAGDPLRLLTQFAGIVPLTMKKTMRQKGKLKVALEGVLEGRVLEAHDILTELNMVHEMPHEELAGRAAELYLQWTANGAYVPVVSPTHAQADEIAAKIREGLRERGDLTGDDHTVRKLVQLGDWSPAKLAAAKKAGGEEGVLLLRYGAYRDETQKLAVGDLVRTTMGGKSKDGLHKLNNGQKYTISGFTEAGDPILDNGWVIDKDWGGLAQRYVTTGQGTQGVTAWNGIVVYGTPSLVATREEGFYVPVSRVRSQVAVLTDSNAELREAIVRQDKRKLAVELKTSQKPKPSSRSFMAALKKRYEQLRGYAADAIRKARNQERDGHGR